MKILKICAVVAGLHLLALILIFVNPGCSSTSHPAPVASTAPAAVAPAADPAPAVPAVPVVAAEAAPADAAPAPEAAAINFFPPTRPGTPVAQALAGQPVADVTPAVTYVVKPGDSLGLIARHHHLKTSALAAANHLRTGAVLHVGQKLLIPERNGAAAPAAAQPAAEAAAPVRSAPVVSTGKETTYTVKAGDRLASIAHRFGLTTSQLGAANNVTNPQLIRIGQTLVIPAGGHAVHKTAKKAAPAEEAPAEEVATSPAPAEATPVVPAAAPAAAPDSASADAVPVIRLPSDAAPSSAPAPDDASTPAK